MHLLIDEILFRLARVKRAARRFASSVLPSGGGERRDPERPAEFGATLRSDSADDPIDIGFQMDSWGDTPESLGEMPRVPDEAWRSAPRRADRPGAEGAERRPARSERAQPREQQDQRPASSRPVRSAQPVRSEPSWAPERSVAVSPLRSESRPARRAADLPAWAAEADRAAAAWAREFKDQQRSQSQEQRPTAGRGGGGGPGGGPSGGVFRSAWSAILWAIWRFGRAIALMMVAGAACVGIVVATATWEVLRFVPDDSGKLMDGREKGSVTVLDRDGQLLGVRGQRFRRVTVDDAAPVLVDAILSTEDRRFYWHFGVDPLGLMRAIVVNLRAERIEQGGSSITQQVAKLAFLTNERRFTRKLRELPLALALEWRYSKDEILSIYLNRAYLGAGSFGFEAAARRYFAKSARDVNAAESALLSGLLRAPSRWSPTNDFAAAQDRARVVLGAMVDSGAIDRAEEQEAETQLSELQPHSVDETAPFFIDWVADQIPDTMWKKAPDLILQTTLDRTAQQDAEAAIEKVFEEQIGKKDKDAEAAAIVVAPDGGVRAMVGGRDYGRSQFNRAVSARRQMGSAFKPFVYSAALETGMSPNALIEDAPIRIGKWAPKNYSHTYRGFLPMATALAKSSNVAAVRVSQQIGVKRVIEVARRFGFGGDIPPYPSIALGVLEASPLEVANAYGVIRRQGRATPAYGVEEIRNRTGEVIWRRAPPPAHQAITASSAEYMTAMLREVVTNGTGRRASLGEFRPVAGKTGTTQDYRDAWFAGFSADLLAVVWMGKDDFSQLDGVTGGRWPAEIWRETMAPLHEGLAVAALAERSVETIDPEVLELRAAAATRQRTQRVRYQEETQPPPRRVRQTTTSERAARLKEFKRNYRTRFRD